MSKQRIVLRFIAAAGAVGVLTACGQSTTPAKPSIDVAAQAQLRHDVHALAAALAGHRLARAHAALDSLNADAAAAHTAGKISAPKFAEIRAAAKKLDADLDRLTNRPTPTVTIISSAPAPVDHGDHGGGPGHHGGGPGDHGGGHGDHGKGGKDG